MKRYLFIAMLCMATVVTANAATKCQTVEIEVKDYVPVQKCTIIEKKVPVKVYKDVEKIVLVTEEKLEFEEKEINIKKKEMVEEEYTENVIQKEMVEETVMKKACKLVPKEMTKEVCKTVMEKACDPCTGKQIDVPVQVKGTATYTVMEKVLVEIPCKVQKCVEKTVPVTKKRMVCKWVPATSMIKVAVCKPIQVKKTVTVQEPVIEMKTVQEKVVTTEYKEITKKVKKTVEVNVCDTCEEPAPCDPCKKKVKPCDPCSK